METELFTLLFTALGALVVATSVITEVLKNTVKKLPPEIAAFITAMALTLAAFFGYCSYFGKPIEWYTVAGAVVAGFFVSYGAQFGFDKLKSVLEKLKQH